MSTTPSDPDAGQLVGWDPPPPDECEEYTYPSAVGDMGDVEVFRQSRDTQDKLVDFAIIQMTPYNGRLVRVAVADICHSELHVHIYNQRGERIDRKRIRPVATQPDVDDCYDAALAWVEENWEDCKRRWRRGRA